MTDKAWNSRFNFDHINDNYFRTKLETGLIRYCPEEWVVLEEAEDNAESKGGRR